MNRKKIRPIIVIICSNIFLILAFSFSNEKNQTAAIAQNHKMVLYPIDLHVPLEDIKSVSLYDEFDNLIIEKAILYPKENEISDLFPIEIPEEDLLKIINYKGKRLRAFPRIQAPINKNIEFTF